MSQSERRPRRRQCRAETLYVGLAEDAVPELGEIVDALPPRSLIDVLIHDGESFEVLQRVIENFSQL